MPLVIHNGDPVDGDPIEKFGRGIVLSVVRVSGADDAAWIGRTVIVTSMGDIVSLSDGEHRDGAELAGFEFVPLDDGEELHVHNND